jgi:hypothetical protein
MVEIHRAAPNSSSFSIKTNFMGCLPLSTMAGFYSGEQHSGERSSDLQEVADRSLPFLIN